MDSAHEFDVSSPVQDLFTPVVGPFGPSTPDDVDFRSSNVTKMAASVEPFQLRYGPLATVAITSLAAILVFVTFGGNLLVIAAFRVDSQLQRVNNYFLLSLAVADFAIGAVSMPLFTVYLLLGRWPLGKLSSSLVYYFHY